MIFDSILYPVNSFELAFNEPNLKKTFLTIFLAGLFLALSIFLLTSSLVLSILSFLTNFLNWIILGSFLCFFEFVHAKKKAKSSSNSFSKALSVTGVLWKINLVAYALILLSCLILPILEGIVFSIIAGLLFILLIILVLFWVINSFKMLKIVFKASKWKLLINWFFLMLLNSLTAFVIGNFMSSLFL